MEFEHDQGQGHSHKRTQAVKPVSLPGSRSPTERRVLQVMARWPPLLKLARAHHHFAKLKADIQRFERSNPAVLVPEFKPNRPGHDIRFIVRKPVPIRYGPMIGDVIYNLRAALDYAVYELTIAHTGHPLDGTAFPICRTRQHWEQPSRKTACGFAPNTGRYKLRGVHPKVRSSISRIQPFRRKGHWPLLWLEELWNADKHRTLHIVSAVPNDAVGHMTLRGGALVTRQVFYRGIPDNNAIVARFTYSNGTTEGDVHVEMENSFALAFDEPMPGKKPWGVVQTLELFNYSLVASLLAIYSRFIPEMEQAFSTEESSRSSD